MSCITHLTSSTYNMLELFELVSAFKVAYALLQQAHFPYDPLRIENADELAVRYLSALCKIRRRVLKVHHFHKNIPTDLHLLLPKIQIKESVLKSLKNQDNAKKCQIQQMHKELLKLEIENAELAERLINKTTQLSQCIDFSTFQGIVNSVYISVHDFAKPLISLMKASGWNLDRAANSVQDSVLYPTRCHKKYAFEAYISRRMFSRFETHKDNIRVTFTSEDPMEYLIQEPYSPFSIFCRGKYLLLIHPNLEHSFFGNLEHRNLVSIGKHPRTQFYQAFVKMARWFWVLQGVMDSLTPKAVFYGVKRGVAFCDNIMDRVDEDLKGFVESNHRHSGFKVAFMIMPGFRSGRNVVKPLVYCCHERT